MDHWKNGASHWKQRHWKTVTVDHLKCRGPHIKSGNWKI